ncbi:MAG: hypothetical protein IJ814_08095 [Paludibacteraceae bacterium]|nr:hypothetical protein [Paludibacteraceae bacterium]
MYGIRISTGKPIDWQFPKQENTFVRQWETDGIRLSQWSLCKFEKDKLWLEDENNFLVVEGVLFNRSEIAAQWQQTDIAAWRGSFSCVRIHKKTHEIQVFNDQIGSHMLFWCQTDQGIYVSPDLFELAHFTGLQEMSTEFMRRILESGYGNDERTMVKGIRRVGAGQVLTIKNGKAEVTRYYNFDNKPVHLDENEALARTNELFRQAVKRVIDKNEEYGL